MAQDANKDAQRVYVESLRWRQQELQAKIEAIGREIAARTRDEAELKQQLKAVDQLLSAEGEPAADPNRVTAVRLGTDASPSGNGPNSDAPSISFAGWGPKARAIYAAAAEVIKEAGVPLHYRVLAEEVQRHVALGGKDPGATLIAHLHRAQDVFPRVGRGIYGLQGMVDVDDSVEPAVPAVRRRRHKARRRAR